MITLVCAFAWTLVPQEPEIWTFDAGAGDASLLRAPGAGSTLIDAGMGGLPDQAGMALTRAALAVGSRSIDIVFLTHPHADHTRSLEGLAARLGVNRVWAPPGFDRSETGKRVGEWAKAHGIAIEDASRGLKIEFERGPIAAGLELEILFPPGQGSPGSIGAVNDVSLALRVSRRGDRFLFLGDLEEDGIAALLCADRDLQAQTLLAPHHGRQNKLWPALLERVRPRYVIISGAGEGGARALAERLERSGVIVFATWRNGAVRTVWRQGTGWLPAYWQTAPDERRK